MLIIKEIREKKNITQDELSKLSGISKRMIAGYEAGENDITFNKMQKIASALKVGIDEIFIDPNKKSILKSEISHLGIPLIPVEALAGYGNGEIVIKESDVEKRYFIPEFDKADYLIRIKGDIMYPKYCAGDIVACIRVDKADFIQWNRVYVLDTVQGIIVKRILKGRKADEWKLRSDNPSYEDFYLNPDHDIYNISLVLGGVYFD